MALQGNLPHGREMEPLQDPYCELQVTFCKLAVPRRLVIPCISLYLLNDNTTILDVTFSDLWIINYIKIIPASPKYIIWTLPSTAESLGWHAQFAAQTQCFCHEAKISLNTVDLFFLGLLCILTDSWPFQVPSLFKPGVLLCFSTTVCTKSDCSDLHHYHHCRSHLTFVVEL